MFSLCEPTLISTNVTLMWKAKRAQASISVFFVSSVVKRKGKLTYLINLIFMSFNVLTT